MRQPNPFNDKPFEYDPFEEEVYVFPRKISKNKKLWTKQDRRIKKNLPIKNKEIAEKKSKAKDFLHSLLSLHGDNFTRLHFHFDDIGFCLLKEMDSRLKDEKGKDFRRDHVGLVIHIREKEDHSGDKEFLILYEHGEHEWLSLDDLDALISDMDFGAVRHWSRLQAFFHRSRSLKDRLADLTLQREIQDAQRLEEDLAEQRADAERQKERQQAGVDEVKKKSALHEKRRFSNIIWRPIPILSRRAAQKDEDTNTTRAFNPSSSSPSSISIISPGLSDEILGEPRVDEEDNDVVFMYSKKTKVSNN